MYALNREHQKVSNHQLSNQIAYPPPITIFQYLCSLPETPKPKQLKQVDMRMGNHCEDKDGFMVDSVWAQSIIGYVHTEAH